MQNLLNKIRQQLKIVNTLYSLDNFISF